jgi:hypothetical protein
VPVLLAQREFPTNRQPYLASISIHGSDLIAPSIQNHCYDLELAYWPQGLRSYDPCTTVFFWLHCWRFVVFSDLGLVFGSSHIYPLFTFICSFVCMILLMLTFVMHMINSILYHSSPPFQFHDVFPALSSLRYINLEASGRLPCRD